MRRRWHAFRSRSHAVAIFSRRRKAEYRGHDVPAHHHPLNYAPTIGSFVAAVPPVLLAILMLGWARAAILGGAYLVINITIGAVIEPKLLGERMGLSPLVVLMSLVFWGWVWGAIGLLLAVPMTMMVKIALEQTTGMRAVAVLLGSASAARHALRRQGARPRNRQARGGPADSHL